MLCNGADKTQRASSQLPLAEYGEPGHQRAKGRYAETYAVLTPGPANAHPLFKGPGPWLSWKERQPGYILNSSWLYVTLM